MRDFRASTCAGSSRRDGRDAYVRTPGLPSTWSRPCAGLVSWSGGPRPPWTVWACRSPPPLPCRACRPGSISAASPLRGRTLRRISGLLTSLSLLALGGSSTASPAAACPRRSRRCDPPLRQSDRGPTPTAEVNNGVREAVQGRLGLRQASENQADAVVRGSITRYEPDLPVAYQGQEGNTPTVARRLVQITVSVGFWTSTPASRSGSAVGCSWRAITRRAVRSKVGPRCWTN